jgi:hypothetical protein
MDYAGMEICHRFRSGVVKELAAFLQVREKTLRLEQLKVTSARN